MFQKGGRSYFKIPIHPRLVAAVGAHEAAYDAYDDCLTTDLDFPERDIKKCKILTESMPMSVVPMLRPPQGV